MRGARSPPTSHHSSYIMEQIIRATLRDADALRVRCKQRNNLSDDHLDASIVCELRANHAIEHSNPRHTRTLLAVLSNGTHWCAMFHLQKKENSRQMAFVKTC